MVTRRHIIRLIGAGSLCSLAGCLSPGGALSMSQVETDTDIGDIATETVDSDRRPEVATLLDDALSDGTANIDGEQPPLDPDRPVTWRGSVYDVSWTVADQRERNESLVVARLAESDAKGSQIDYEELPEVDRTQLSELREQLDRSEDMEDDEQYEIRIRYTDDTVINESVLVSSAEYDLVVVDDQVVSIETQQTETTVTTFTYELEVLADSLGAYGEELRTDRLVDLESIPEEERELLDEAIEDEQVVVGRDDEAFMTLGERLLAHEPIYIQDRVGEWLVDYEGELYWTELDTLRTTELVDRLEEYDQE